MTDEELRTLVGNLAVATASNTEAIRELKVTVENQSESIRELRTTVETQERVMAEGFASLTATAENQARSIEFMRESVSYNTEMVTSALNLVAEALKLSANTSRNLDRQEQDTAEMKLMIGILIRENQADRVRFSRLEGQN